MIFRLLKEQEKSERQEAVRREREIRNQQLLEVSACQFRAPSFCLDLVVSFVKDLLFSFYLRYLRFCILSTYRACRMLFVCAVYLSYIYICIFYIYTLLKSIVHILVELHLLVFPQPKTAPQPPWSKTETSANQRSLAIVTGEPSMSSFLLFRLSYVQNVMSPDRNVFCIAFPPATRRLGRPEFRSRLVSYFIESALDPAYPLGSFSPFPKFLIFFLNK